MGRELPSDRPLWEVLTYTDGRDAHGVVLRWNHWIGDGISTQVALARLFDYNFEVPAAIQQRAIDLSSVTLWQRLRVTKLMFEPVVTSARRSSWWFFGTDAPTEEGIRELVDTACLIVMDASEFDEVRAAAKAQSTTVTSLLVAAARKTFVDLQLHFGGEEAGDPIQMMTTAALRRDVDSFSNESKLIGLRVPRNARVKDVSRIWSDTLNRHFELMSAERAVLNAIDRAGHTDKVCDILLNADLEKKKSIDFFITAVPGPKETISICGTPVLGLYNCLGSSGTPRFTCTTYAGRLYVSLSTWTGVSAEAAEVRRAWNTSLAYVIAGHRNKA